MSYLQNDLKGYDNQLGVAFLAPLITAAPGIIGGITKLFGKKGPSEGERISDARSLAQQIISSKVNTLPAIVKLIEYWIGRNRVFDIPSEIYNCPPSGSGESTEGRACIIIACLVARQLGWSDPLYGICDPLLKRSEGRSFPELERRLLAFFRKKLPELKAKLEKQQAVTVTPKPVQLVQPAPLQPLPIQQPLRPLIITQPAMAPTEPIIQKAGMENPMLWVGLGLAAIFAFTQMGK